MKKIIAIILSALLCFGMLPSAMAAGVTATVNAEFNPDLDALVVSGNVLSERGNIKLALKVTDLGGTIVYTGQLVLPYDEDANNNYEYSFAPAVLDSSCPSGTYNVTVSGKWLDADATTTYNHVGLDRQYAALSAYAAAVASQNGQNLATAISTYGADLGVDAALYTSLLTDGVTAFNTVLFTKTYTVPAGYVSSADVAALKQQITAVRADYKEAALIGEFNDLSAKAAISAWIDNNAAKFNADIPATTENEAEFFVYLNQVKGEDAFAARVASNPIITTIDGIRSQLYANAFLSIIEAHHYSETRAILEKYPAFFGIDTTKLALLDDTQDAAAYETVKGSYLQIADVGVAFNAIVDGYINAGSSGGSAGGSISGGSSSGGSSSGGSSSGGSSVIAPVKPESSDNVQNKTPEFTDLGSVSWAKEAINFLAEKGIASGKSDGVFAPNDYIKRCEFIKLLVAATNTSISQGDISSFADVSATAWYSPYLAAAEKSGLILGNESKQFMPDSYITRQDMATILYRALGLEGYTNETLTFADGDSISSYAKEAVACLASEKIINGMGNNMFMPLENATRAQVAVIIYNMIK